MLRFAGKVALVTGSGRGIGRAIALKLAAEGADVVVNYFRHREPAEETAAAITALGRRALVVKAHVGKEESLRELFTATCEAFGGLDFFIANAASGVLKPITEIDRKDWEWTLGINAQSLLFGAQEAVKLMAGRGGGAIVAVTSAGSTRVLPAYGIVGVSKAAIDAIIRYLAVELAPQGIAVNAVSPGVVDTGALDFFPFGREQIVSTAAQRTPAGRIVTPEEVAEVVAFLCSPAARMICGQVIVIDGGLGLLW